jgi:hypothetical protein
MEEVMSKISELLAITSSISGRRKRNRESMTFTGIKLFLFCGTRKDSFRENEYTYPLE